jgi:ribosomal protein S18 acetylase RimI-like enzyme
VTQRAIDVRRALDEERPAVARTLAERWGSTQIVSRGRVHDAEIAEVFVAVRDGAVVGSATFVVGGDEAELLTLDSLEEGAGVGSALVEAVVRAATSARATQLVVSTTNDNLHALGFYQRRGFRLMELLPGSVDRARRLKPSIPFVGASGIPIRDELVLVRDLAAVGGDLGDVH